MTEDAKTKRAKGMMVLDTDIKCKYCIRVFVDEVASLEHLKAKHNEYFNKGCHGKTRYPDEATAKLTISLLLTSQSKAISAKYPQRAYACVEDGCNGWHLTSKKSLKSASTEGGQTS
jgi:hypothetical protein